LLEPISSFPALQIDSTKDNFKKLPLVSIDGDAEKFKNLSSKAVCEYPLKAYLL
jgi:hypothetical protein